MARNVVLASLFLGSALGTVAPAIAQDPATSVAAQPGRTRDLPLDAARNIGIDTDEGSWIPSTSLPTVGRSSSTCSATSTPCRSPVATPRRSRAAWRSTRSRASRPTASRSSSRPTATAATTSGPSTSRRRHSKQITKGKGTRYRSPEWTPDGNYVVVVAGHDPDRRRRSCGCSTRTWRRHRSSCAIRSRCSNGAIPVSTIGAAFGKDDRYIWFAQRGGAWEYNAGLPQYQLMTFDRQTGRRETRANVLGSAFRPALSPDGKYLVYGSRYEAQTGLRIRDLQTGEERWLAYPVQRDEQESVASLDVLPGLLVHAGLERDRRVVRRQDLAMPVDGSARGEHSVPRRRRRSTSARSSRSTIRSPTRREFTVRQIRDAVPSPDEKRLAFVALDKLYVMDYPGRHADASSDTEGTEAQPAWSPDGQWIAFVTWTREGGHLYKVRARPARHAGAAHARATRSTVQPAWSPDGKRIVVVRAPGADLARAGRLRGRRGARLGAARRRRGDVHRAGVGRGDPHFVQRHEPHLPVQRRRGARLDALGRNRSAHASAGDGLPGPGADRRTSWRCRCGVKMAPAGDQAFVQVVERLYVVPVPSGGRGADDQRSRIQQRPNSRRSD